MLAGVRVLVKATVVRFQSPWSMMCTVWLWPLKVLVSKWFVAACALMGFVVCVATDVGVRFLRVLPSCSSGGRGSCARSG
eukprot:5832228-Lingulodinium_polyedra.AAC.1